VERQYGLDSTTTIELFNPGFIFNGTFGDALFAGAAQGAAPTDGAEPNVTAASGDGSSGLLSGLPMISNLLQVSCADACCCWRHGDGAHGGAGGLMGQGCALPRRLPVAAITASIARRQAAQPSCVV